MTDGKTLLGGYGAWATATFNVKPARCSYRRARWTDVRTWQRIARRRVEKLLYLPATIRADEVRIEDRFVTNHVEVEELSWRLPYGPRTSACVLKPEGERGKLPAVIALHDHGGFKYFGWRKIVRSQHRLHPLTDQHQQRYYGGAGWPDELARRGYVVLAHDVFPFGSRRIPATDLPDLVVHEMMQHPDVTHRRSEIEADPEGEGSRFEVPPDETEERIMRYNSFTEQHESTIAKALICAGYTWPGVALAEDQAALGYLAGRSDVDARRIACCGLSGGGLRACFLAGLDERIRAGATVGFLTTWRDFVLHFGHTHTWMLMASGLARELDFPEILGLHAPMPALAITATEDPLYTACEVQRAGQMLRAIYEKAGAPAAFQMSSYPGTHRFDRAMQAEAFDWIETALGLDERRGSPRDAARQQP